MHQDKEPGWQLPLINRPISNPMDWQPIDRLILLACLVLFAPVGFGSVLLVTNYQAPQYLNQSLVPILLWAYGLHAILLLTMIFAAFQRRAHDNHWPLFENIIIGGYLVVVIISSYLTGAHFSEGLLLIFLGVNITGVLANVNKIRKCYWVVVPVMLVMMAADFMHSVPYAILLEKSPFEPTGRPLIGWMILRAIIVLILAALIYLCILAMKRWTERESIYLEMSAIDGLTRLTNRNSFIHRGQQELVRARRQVTSFGSSLACIMIDLDHFKEINDTWGHHAGDEVLIVTSKIMMDNARQNDEVGRYGGEEFAILLPGTNLRIAEQIAERLRRKISETRVEVDGHVIEVTASFGVASFPGDGIESMSDLLKAADKALYQAKDKGRNTVVCAGEEDDPQPTPPRDRQ